MADRLHQMNVNYSGKLDRLLLKVTTQNGDEFRIWLTRRYTGLLLNILNKEMDRHGGVKTVSGKQQTTQMFKAGAFEKPFEPEKTRNLPFGEEGFLAFGIKTANTKDGSLVLEILPEKGAGVTFNLNPSLVYLMQNLLSQGLIKAEWNQQILPVQGETDGKVH